MATPFNPYVAGNPVGDSPAFVGRADVLREVVRVLRRPQDNAIVLYGQRRIGKTSILQHLATLLPREGPYRPVYFDLQDKAAWPLGRVLQDLARSIAHALGHPDPDLGPDPETTFRQEWLPTILDDLPDGSSLVLLFDEFDVLADPQKEQAAAAFFPYLRGLLTSDPERLQFAFVIGRNVDDLDNIALSLFKGTPAQRVSLLNEEDTKDLVRLSETNGTLRWVLPVMLWVYKLTCGHPFLTQQLCSHIWERAYDEEPEEPPTVTRADVDAAVPEALEASRNTLEWLWDGLPPAERVVASALAEAGPDPITQDELERLLHESGVRVVIRELQNAPQLLQEWDLIEPADGGYRFRVELLRRWIAENKPLKRVQEELDRIEPVADYFYRAALGLYQSGQLDQAIAPLRQATGLNPNHVGANQLLADILLAQGQPGEARQLLERLYEYQPAAARSRLVQALLAQAQAAEDDDEQLALYEQVLELDSRQPEATAGRRRIWQQRGDAALENNDLEAALEAYRVAGLTEKAAEIEQEIRRRDLAARLEELEALGQKGQYQDALNLARRLADEYPEMLDWASKVAEIEQEMRRRTLVALKELEEKGQYQAALDLARKLADEYPEVKDWTLKVAEIEQEMRRRDLATRLQELEALEKKGRYQDALNLAYKLADEYSGMLDWASRVAEVEQEMRRRTLVVLKELEEKGQYQAALDLARKLADEYPEVKDWTLKVAEIEQEMRRRDLATRLQELEALEKKGRYQDALDLAHKLADEYPGMRDWSPDFERLERQIRLADLYRCALGALQSGDSRTAQTLLVQVVALEPGYKEATRYLHLAVTGVDVAELQDQLESKARLSPLSPWNPLDYLRLLWWVLVIPQRLKAYRGAFGERAERRVGKWLVSTLTWLPFFIPTLALGLRTLIRTIDVTLPTTYLPYATPPTTYLWIGLGLSLAWALTGWIGEQDDGCLVSVAGVVAFVVAFIVAFFIMVEGEVAGRVAFDVAFIVAFDVAFIVALIMAGGVALGVTSGVALGVAFIVALDLWIIPPTPLGMAGVVAVTVAVIVAGVVAIIVAVVVKENLKTGRPSWLAWGAFGALVLAHALIWFCSLDGWRVFQ